MTPAPGSGLHARINRVEKGLPGIKKFPLSKMPILKISLLRKNVTKAFYPQISQTNTRVLPERYTAVSLARKGRSMVRAWSA